MAQTRFCTCPTLAPMIFQKIGRTRNFFKYLYTLFFLNLSSCMGCAVRKANHITRPLNDLWLALICLQRAKYIGYFGPNVWIDGIFSIQRRRIDFQHQSNSLFSSIYFRNKSEIRSCALYLATQNANWKAIGMLCFLETFICKIIGMRFLSFLRIIRINLCAYFLNDFTISSKCFGFRYYVYLCGNWNMIFTSPKQLMACQRNWQRPSH